MKASKEGRRGLWRCFGPARAAHLCVVIVAVCSGRCLLTAQGPPVTPPWSGPWDWAGDLGVAPACMTGDFDEFSHAALIPDGLYRGKVLLWRRAIDANCSPLPTTSSWVFDPTSPSHLLLIGPQPQLPGEIFCSGASWDSRGQLVVAGGLGSSGTQISSYRFRPRAPGVALPPVPPATGPWQIQYSSAFPPWLALADMTIPRYYPTVIALDKDSIALASVSGTIASSSNVVLGGPVFGTHASNLGNPFWEFLPPGLVAWSIPFRPPLLLAGHLPFAPPVTEVYSLHPSGTNEPSPLIDSYPRALQLSTGHVMIASDTPTIPGSANPPTPAGESWGIALRTASFPGQPDSRLWRGPIETVMGPSGLIGLERKYGSAVLLHMRQAAFPFRVYNRLLQLGGKDDGAQTGTQEFRTEVSELILGSVPGSDPVRTAIWQPKAPMIERRAWLNAVVLPTGEILLVGGARYRPGLPNAAVLQPELYSPGPQPTSLGSTVLLAASNPSPALGQPFSNLTPRLYHHVAMLLPDGRVFVGGGESTHALPYTDPGGTTYPTGAYPQAKYSGEVFSPPYVQQLQTPGTHQPVVSSSPSGSFQVNQPGSNSNRFMIEVKLADSGTHVDKVVVLRPASVTHHFDANQRYIELEVVSDTAGGQGQHTLQVACPEYTLAPLGWYMLFIIEQDNQAPTIRIPSEAEFIRLDS